MSSRWTILLDTSLYRPWFSPPSFVAGVKAAAVEMLGETDGAALANAIQAEAAGGIQAFPEPSKGINVDKTGELYINGKAFSEMWTGDKTVALAKAEVDLRQRETKLQAKRQGQQNSAMDTSLQDDVRGACARGALSTANQLNEAGAQLNKILEKKAELGLA